jgi:hypothetical protein
MKGLVCHQPEGMTVGAIAKAFGAPQNTISAHLGILDRARLVVSRRQGRSVVYRADLGGMQSLIEYLVGDCCHGDAGLCAELFGQFGKGGHAPACDPTSSAPRPSKENVE